MKAKGRISTPLTAVQKEAVLRYLNTGQSLVELAKEYGVEKHVLYYWVKKFRKEGGKDPSRVMQKCVATNL